MFHNSVAVRVPRSARRWLSQKQLTASLLRRCCKLLVVAAACGVTCTAQSALIGQYRADLPMGVSSGNVVVWPNQVDGSGLTNAVASAGNRPARVTTTINGNTKTVVDFSSHLMNVPLTIPAVGTMMFVMNRDAGTGGYFLGGGTANDGLTLLPALVPDGSANDALWVIARNGGTPGDIVSTAHMGPEFDIYTVSWGDGGVSVYKGLAAAGGPGGGISSISNPGTGVFNLGGPLDDDGSARFSGQIAEFRIWDTELTTLQRGIAHSELQNTWFVPEPNSMLIGLASLVGIAVAHKVRRRR
jgi:hypothetical protein